MTTARKAKRVVAHWYPSLSYTASTRLSAVCRPEGSYPHLLWTPKSGKAAAKLLRAKLLAASALAAYIGYESTRYVKIPENTRRVLFR